MIEFIQDTACVVSSDMKDKHAKELLKIVPMLISSDDESVILGICLLKEHPFFKNISKHTNFAVYKRNSLPGFMSLYPNDFRYYANNIYGLKSYTKQDILEKDFSKVSKKELVTTAALLLKWMNYVCQGYDRFIGKRGHSLLFCRKVNDVLK